MVHFNELITDLTKTIMKELNKDNDQKIHWNEFKEFMDKSMEK